jgi:SPP1 family predicted phage head-tail adaptor
MSDPARFNRRLSLEAPVETPDGAGGVTRGFEQVATVWAEITPTSARTEFFAAHLGADVTHRIVIRAPRELSVQHRFADGARLFRIVSFRDSDDRRLIEIAAEEHFS